MEGIPFAATWMDLETVILREVKSDWEKQISYDTAYMWNLKKMVQMNFFRKQKTDPQACKTNLWLPGERGERNKLGDWDWHEHTTVYIK